MKESFYFHDDTVILNYSKQYVTSKHGIIHTDVFDAFLDGFLVYLANNHYDLYKYLEEDGLRNHERIKKEIKFVLTALLVEAPSEIHDEYIISQQFLKTLLNRDIPTGEVYRDIPFFIQQMNLAFLISHS